MQIDTNVLLIITSISNELLVLSTSMILNNLESPKYEVSVCFIAIFGCGAHFKSELRQYY